MSNIQRRPTQKPFAIRERLFLFACDVVDAAQKLHTRGPIAGSLSIQLVSAAVSAAANAEEADDASDDSLLQEANELRLILTTIIRNNAKRGRKA